MCIYCGGSNYRKIYESHYGSIPVDENGRRYDIHHIDGNRKNNDISNLQAVTIEEHLSIHAERGEWNACQAIILRMQMSPGEISQAAKELNYKRVQNGTHPWVGGDQQRKLAKTRIDNGTHHWLGGELQRNQAVQRVSNGTHNFLGSKTQLNRVENGTHPFVGGHLHQRLISEGRYPAQQPENRLKNSIRQQARVLSGQHNFLKESICPHCSKIGRGSAMNRWHFNNCKHRAKT